MLHIFSLDRFQSLPSQAKDDDEGKAKDDDEGKAKLDDAPDAISEACLHLCPGTQ